jgi:hypothetical protein
MPITQLLRKRLLGGSWFEANQGKKLVRSISTHKLGMLVHASNSSCLEGICRRISVQGQPGEKSTRPYLKNKLKQKWLVAQEEECLHRKHKALSLKPQCDQENKYMHNSLIMLI